MNLPPLLGQPPKGFRSGFVGLIGRPNVGKSTLLNHLVGQKIAITSPIAQTTRNRLRGILTTTEAQFIFVDTPGIHKPHHELGNILVKNARVAIQTVDVVLFVVDGSQVMGRGDAYIAELLQRSKTPVLLGLNKIDLQTTDQDASRKIQASYEELAATCGSSEIVHFSALTGSGTQKLLRCLQVSLEVGPYYYPPELVTDQPERFIMGELIREQVLGHTREEVPHSVAVTIDRVDEEPTITRVLATIHVERDSQKGILIGKKAQMLKAIGSKARQQLQKLLEGKVYLELFVKVSPKWRQSRLHLREFGYRPEES